jgi:catalase
VNTAVGKTARLSQIVPGKGTVKGRKIAILVADGFALDGLDNLQSALKNAGASYEIVAPHLGMVKTGSGQQIQADKSLLNDSIGILRRSVCARRPEQCGRT